MAPHVNLNALRIFAEAARLENFQRAAEVLNLSHGAVSQRIRQLEQDLGVVLFERQARGVRLTPHGARYRRAVDEALAILATAGAELVQGAGQVTLHLGPSFASRWLMPRVQGLAECHPDIVLTTEVHDTLLLRALGRHEIVIWPGRTGDGAPGRNLRRLTELRLVAVCSPALSGPVDLPDLLGLPLLQDAHRRWDGLLAATGGRAAGRVLNFDRSALALDAAAQGHGVAIAPSYMVQSDLDAGRLHEVWRSPEPTGEHLFISWSDDGGTTRPVRRTVDWILGQFGLDPVS